MSQQLNLPDADIRIKHEGDRSLVWDIIRKRYIVITPEEWVRQHFVHYLINHLAYPKSLMKVESGLTVNKLNKRSDILVMNRDGSPWMLVECKSPYVRIDQDTLIQAANYNRTYAANYLTLTNGIDQVVCDVSGPMMRTISALPKYPTN